MSTALALRVPEQEPPPASLNFSDLLFIFFRHKWKIILCATTGILAAAAAYFLIPTLYECQAKLLVRYVVEKNAIDGVYSSTEQASSSGDGEVLINSEVEILNSRDLIGEVAEAVGIERILAGPKSNDQKDGPKVNAVGTTFENSRNLIAEVAEAVGIERLLAGSKSNDQQKDPKAEAVRAILANLRISAVKLSNIISISYKNRDPELAVQVVKELVNRYFDKHLEFHRSTGAFAYVKQETDQLQTRLIQTEKELKQLSDSAGIISTAENAATLDNELVRGEQELNGAQTELAAQQARVTAIEQGLAWAKTEESAKNSTQQVSSEVIQEYQGLTGRLTILRQSETDLLARYTPQSRIVQVKHAQIEDLDKKCRDLEKQYPGLLETVPAAVSFQAAQRDLVSEKARLEELKAKVGALSSREADLRARVKAYSQIAPRLADLNRKKEVEEASLKYNLSSLEKARVDETLNPSRMPNISVVQKPEEAERSNEDRRKIVLILAFAGTMVGIAIAALIDLVLDRTVKRPLELETRLSIPLFLAVPHFSPNGHSRLRLLDAGQAQENEEPLTGVREGTSPSIAPWDSDHFIRPYCEAIRDRLLFDFECKGMSHKPKLVGLIGLSENAGASTLATGLAASLSDSSDGKVLLIDKPLSAKKFYNMLQEYKAGDFDYVVFDMPSLGETSSALPLASFMDKVLLVVEAEKTNRDTIKGVYARLAAKVDVSIIFNKSRSHGPRWLESATGGITPF